MPEHVTYIMSLLRTLLAGAICWDHLVDKLQPALSGGVETTKKEIGTDDDKPEGEQNISSSSSYSYCAVSWVHRASYHIWDFLLL